MSLALRPVENLSIVILTHNEEERVGRAVKSALFASELVVFDSLSQDATLDIIRETWTLGGRSPEDLKIYVQPWKGFLETRNESIEHCGYEWILWLDADEWISGGLERELREICDSDPERLAPVFKMPRLSRFLGREIRHGGWYPDRKARLGRRGACQWVAGPLGAKVHEDLKPLGDPSLNRFEVGTLRGELGHEPFRSEQEQQETNRRYSLILAEATARDWSHRARRIPSHLWISWRVLVKLLENYIWKRGFLDGRVGWIIAKGSSTSLRLRFETVRELMLKDGNKKSLREG